MRVLVYGGGVAASAVAIELCERQHEVVLVGPVEPSRWPMIADGGIDLGTDPEAALAASLACGDHLASPAALAAMWDQAPTLLPWLEGALGIPFAHHAGHAALRRLPGAPEARARFVEARTELCLAEALELAALRRGAVLREPFELVELAQVDGVVVGAVLTDERGRLSAVPADAVVIAAGGPEKTLRGDLGAIATERAVAVALRAGAVVTDLDLSQDNPCALWRDGVPTVLSPAWRAEGAFLWVPTEPTDARIARDVPGRERNRLLAEDHPGWAELAPDDLVAAGLRRAFDEGQGVYDRKRRSVRRRAYLDLSHLPERLSRGRLESELGALERRFGVDATRAAVAVAPARLGSLGGIWVRPEGDFAHAASLPGLFAVGASAPLYHGVCRMGGTGLLADLVGARRAAQSVTAYDPEPSEARAREALDDAIDRAGERANGSRDGAKPVDAFSALVAAARDTASPDLSALREQGLRCEGFGPAALTPDAFDDLALYVEATARCRAVRSAGVRRHAFVRMAPHGLVLVGGFELDGHRVDSAVNDFGAPPRRYAEPHG